MKENREFEIKVMSKSELLRTLNSPLGGGLMLNSKIVGFYFLITDENKIGFMEQTTNLVIDLLGYIEKHPERNFRFGVVQCSKDELDEKSREIKLRLYENYLDKNTSSSWLLKLIKSFIAKLF